MRAAPDAPGLEAAAARPMRGLGVNTHFERRANGWKVERLLPLVQAMGASSVRQGVAWDWVEREKGRFAFDGPSCEWVDAVLDAGLGLVLILCGENRLYEDSLDPDAFANYAARVARWLRGRRVHAYEVWNEPTNFTFLKRYGGNWSARPPCAWADRYCELAAKVARAVKREDPDATVIVNPGECQYANMIRAHPEAFAEIDGVSHHTYPTRFPPETVPWGGRQIHERDGVTVADERHSAESVWGMTRAHARECLGREPVLFMTEYGYTTYDQHSRPGAFMGVTERAQAAYLVRGLVLNLSAGVREIDIYDFMDDGTDPFEQEDNFGLVRHERAGYTPKESYFAVQRLAREMGPDWEPARDFPARLEVTLEELPVNEDEWQRLGPPLERFLQITEPVLRGFRVGEDALGFVWKAGRLSGELRETRGSLLWKGPARPERVELLDLVTGDACEPAVEETEGALAVRGVTVGGHPVLVRLAGAFR